MAKREKSKYKISKWLGPEERELIEEIRELCQRRHGTRPEKGGKRDAD